MSHHGVAYIRHQITVYKPDVACAETNYFHGGDWM
jgi:hypothetical protein